MRRVLSSIARALGDLRDRRIVAILVLPMSAALAIWAVLAWWLWPDLAAWLGRAASGTVAGKWIEGVGAGWAIRSAATLALVVIWVPALLITAIIFTELFAMPVIVRRVGDLHYPRLAMKAGGTAAGSVLNAMVGIALFCVLWIVTLPLWLTGIAALVLPPLLSAYLNQRLFRYDALGDHASREEYRVLIRTARGRLFLLGLLLAGVYYVPLLNLLAPTVTGLAFTHFCLGELERLRSETAAAGGKNQGAP